MLSKIKKLNGLYLTLILSASGALLSFAVTFLLAHYLGETESTRAILYGKIQYYLGIITTLTIFLKFGFVSFTVKQTQISDNKTKTFSKIFVFFDFISIIALPVFFLIAYFGLSKLEKNIYLIFMLFVAAFFFSLVSIISSFILGKKQYKLSIFIETLIPKSVQLIVFGLLIILKKYSFVSDNYVLIFGIIYFLVSLPFLITYVRKTKIIFTKSEIISIVVFFLISLVGNFGNSFSKVLQGELFHSASQEIQEQYDIMLGSLSLALQIVSMGTIFVGVIANIAKPNFANFSKNGKNNELIDLFKKTIRLSGYISIPFMVAFFVEAEKVLAFFGMSSYPDFLRVATIYGLVLAIGGPCGTLLEMAGFEKYELISGAINLIVFIAMSYLLKNITIYALPIGLAIGTLAGKILNLIFIKKTHNKNPLDLRDIIFLVLFAFICLAVFNALNRIGNYYLWLIMNAVFGVALIILGFVFSPNKSDKYFFFRKDVQ